MKEYEWKIIDGKKKWTRKCPKCNIEVTYSQKMAIERATRENRVCMKCRQSKIEKTCLEKFGSKSPLECKKIFDKTKQTCKEKYGKEHPFQAGLIQNKVKNTLITLYGVNSPSKIFTHKNKLQNKRKSGSWKNWKNKTKNTLINRYGDESYNNKDVRYNTMIRLYGVKHTAQNKEILKKIQETTLKKYGKTNVQLMHDAYKNKDTRIELKVKNILNKNNLVFDRNFEIFDNGKNQYRYYDFKLSNILIECDGDYWHSLPHNIINDKYKDELAKKSGYLLLRFKETEIMKKDFDVNFMNSLTIARQVAKV